MANYFCKLNELTDSHPEISNVSIRIFRRAFHSHEDLILGVSGTAGEYEGLVVRNVGGQMQQSFAEGRYVRPEQALRAAVRTLNMS